jgi:hypothetical protein
LNRILFSYVTIFDGSGAAPFPGEVLVEGNRIAAVARGGELMGIPVGEVKVGYLADLLADIRILQDRDRIPVVMKDGHFHRCNLDD